MGVTGLTTIRQFANDLELQLAIDRLEAEGIECFTHDDFTAAIFPQVNSVADGVGLAVRNEDSDRAALVIKDIG